MSLFSYADIFCFAYKENLQFDILPHDGLVIVKPFCFVQIEHLKFLKINFNLICILKNCKICDCEFTSYNKMCNICYECYKKTDLVVTYEKFKV